MVNVLVIGATGYLGQVVAYSLVQSGDHRVFGLARTAAKAKQLAAQEITPVLGSISDNAELLKAIHNSHINIIVDAAGAPYEETSALVSSLKAAGHKRQKAHGIHAPKLGYIYISGAWVHGSSDAQVTDLTPVGLNVGPSPPAEITAWRVGLEEEILSASDALDTMVIRPALIYGRSCTIWSMYLGPLYAAAKSGEKSVSLLAGPQSRPGLVHVDDAAAGVHCAVDKLTSISGTGVYPIFDLVTSQESMRELFEAAGKAFGYEGQIVLEGAGDNIFAKAMSSSMNGNSGRAKQILGWVPKKFGFMQGMDVFAKAWEAAQ